MLVKPDSCSVDRVSRPAPSGAVTTMVPVGTAQVGCVVAEAVGAAGAAGAFKITGVAPEIQVPLSERLHYKFPVRQSKCC